MKENFHSVKFVNTKKETFRRVTSMLSLFPDYFIVLTNTKA